MGVGIDIVKISRIKLNSRFLNFVLCNEELEILKNKTNKQEFVAGRFAAKEAFLKANGAGLGKIALKDIKVLYNNKGCPIIVHGDQIFENISISHEKEYAIAIAII